MDRRSGLALLLGWLVAIGSLGWYVRHELVVGADLRLYLPSPRNEEQRLLLEEVGQGPASRLLLISLEGAEPALLAEMSQAMVGALRSDPRFSFVGNGGADLDGLPDELLPYRYLLTPAFDDQPLDPTLLAKEMRNRLKDLASPAAGIIEEWIRRDPTLEILRLAQAWQPSQEPQRLHDVWFSRRGDAALLLAETTAAGFDPGKQQEAMREIERAFATARRDRGTRITVTGAGAFSVMMQERTQREATLIGTVDSVAMILLLVIAYGSARSVALGVLPLASGGLAGLAAVTACFGVVHGITLAFGFTLIGVAQDYPIHLLSHQHRGITPLDNARAIWPTLATGVAGTCIAYLAFLFSGVNGLAQLAVFAIAGLAVAGLTTRILLPRLMPPDARDCGASEMIGRICKAVDRLPRPRWLAALVATACLAVILLAPWPMWQSDLGALTPVPRSILQQDAALRAELGAPDMRYLLVVQGNSAEQVLQRCESLTPRLDSLVEESILATYSSPARYLPSAKTQEMRRAALPGPNELREAVTKAASGTPFKPGIFEPFIADVARARELRPLMPQSVAPTPLGARLESLLTERGGNWTGLIALGGVREPNALARLAGSAGSDVVMLDLKAASEGLVAHQREHILRALAIAAVLLVAVVGIALRSVARAARVLQPMFLTTLFVLAVLHASGTALTLFHLVALVLAAGLGLDYALFFERAASDPAERRRTVHAVIVCSISTFIVFAVIAASSLPVLRGIGLTVTLGVVANFLFALLLARSGPQVTDARA